MQGMGSLREVQGRRACILEPEHLVGRTGHCSLLLSHAYISGQHALIRWTGRAWEALDRGSRNGTFLNGVGLSVGQSHELRAGDVLAFGHPREQWRLEDASEPRPMVLAEGAETWSLSEDGAIGIPSSSNPESQLFRDGAGLWRLERPGLTTTVVRNGDRFEAGGRWWRFSCPDPVGSTAAVEPAPPQEANTLLFTVSRDEEFVELSVQSEGRTVSLGSRSHNYLLLVLARTRNRDHEEGSSDAAAGWMDKDELAQQLRMTPEQIDGEVFRIRQHFIRHGLADGASIVERRPRIKQLRLGWRNAKITSI